MVLERTARAVLDRDFLAIRAELLNLAAALDRIDRGGERSAVADDPRLGRVGEALAILVQRQANRAERIQLVFSREYDAQWRRPGSSR